MVEFSSELDHPIVPCRQRGALLMQKTFIETEEFTEWFREHLSEEELITALDELLANPDRGKVMPGCGGLRKLRIADPSRQKGKRGGARIIYLHIPEADEIHLITVYGKDQQDDLSPADKKLLRQLVAVLQQDSRRDSSRRRP